jgi:small subunit ribosomal protein S6
MKTYELTYIISPEMSSEEAEAKAKEIETAVASREGIILKQTNPTAVTLSYPIKKRASGFFAVIEFQAEPEKLVELKEMVQKDGKIVRYMLIIKEPARIRRERRGKRETIVPEIKIEHKTETVENKAEETEAPAQKTVEKPKVELKDIEQKLDELLGE